MSEGEEIADPEIAVENIAKILPAVKSIRPHKEYGKLDKKDHKAILDGIRQFKPLYIIAQELGVCRQTLYTYLREKMDVNYRDMKESMLDVAENRLFRNVVDGNQNAIEYFLDRQGRSRGYGQQQQLDRQDVPVINIGKIEVTNGDAKPEEKPVEAEVVEKENEQ